MPKGILGQFGLVDWFKSLSSEEQNALRTYNKMGLWTGGNSKQDELTEGDIWTSATKGQFLSEMGLNAISSKDNLFGEKLLIKALEVGEDDSIHRHFTYINLIKLYSSKNFKNIEKCIYYCLEDIKWVEAHIKIVKESFDDGNGIDYINLVSFYTLIEIYEDKRDYNNALKICERAIKINYNVKYFNELIERLKNFNAST
jgi:tetratricopeptide (TPR) repeat protein